MFPSTFARKRDALIAALLGMGSLVLYAATAAPSVAALFDDTLEFQVVVPELGIAHPSGYPLYTLLGKLFVTLLPWRDPAGRLNLFSSVAAAAAVALYYLAARHWSRSTPAALIVAAALAVSPVWWSQATLAEVYALLGLLIALFLYCLFRWEGVQPGRSSDRWLAAAALVAGLGLAHHRMIALIVLPAVVFIFWTQPALLRVPRRWVRPLLCGLAPLALYLYLPLRGQAVTSLDGTYAPTASGTIDWILARGYGVFLTGNPFGVHRDAAFYYDLFTSQLGWLLMLLAGLGIIGAWRYGLRRYAFLLLATLLAVAFGVVYKVQDVEVFFIPAIMLIGLWAALGFVPLLDAAQAYLAGSAGRLGLPRAARPWLFAACTALAVALPLAGPLGSLPATYRAQDRSRAWETYDYGEDIMASAANEAEVIGLGGEITLIRYFREVLGRFSPYLIAIRADSEQARWDALQSAPALRPPEPLLKVHPVYLTRDLPGAAARYSLGSAGPLIAVYPKARPAEPPAGKDLNEGVRLVDYRPEVRATHAGPSLRLNLTWTATRAITESLKISARLLDAAGAPVVSQDAIPVHFAYPTTAWVPGELITDDYDLPLPAGGAGAPYRPLLILYRAADGREIGRVSDLPPLALEP